MYMSPSWRGLRCLFTAIPVYVWTMIMTPACALYKFCRGDNYLWTYDSYVPLYNRFHRGEWITRVSGGEGALDTPGPLNGTSEAL